MEVSRPTRAQRARISELFRPSLSLHPEWQTRFLDFVLHALEPYDGCEIVVATHSALIAQRGIELGLDIIALDGAIDSQQRASEKSIDQTLLDVFKIPVRDSTYVGRLLLSLVMKAEASPDSMHQVRLELLRLRELYESSSIQDVRTLGLISDAMSIVDGADGAQETM